MRKINLVLDTNKKESKYLDSKELDVILQRKLRELDDRKPAGHMDQGFRHD